MKQIRILIILLTIVTSLFGQTNGYVLKNADGSMGSNTAERTFIYTQVRAIPHPVIQYYIGLADARWQQEYIEVRQRGKAIIMDN